MSDPQGVPLPDPAFRADVLAGLARRPRAIPARWFYDRRGSELFEAITDLPEYYPSRTERAILAAAAPAIAELVGPGRVVVEFGSGSSVKTPLLLAAVSPAAYVPVDISGEFLHAAAAGIAARFPGLPVRPVVADFGHPIDLPPLDATGRLGFFPGSTIGNMAPAAAVDLLRRMRDTLWEGAALVIGMDRIKDPGVLVRAYDDAAGVTAAFNGNLLHRINRELAGTIDPADFRHRAVWNAGEARIEMHLAAIRATRFTIAGTDFAVPAGETIHTENSHKYGDRDARLLLKAGGWTVRECWTDPDDLFAVYLAEALPDEVAP